MLKGTVLLVAVVIVEVAADLNVENSAVSCFRLSQIGELGQCSG